MTDKAAVVLQSPLVDKAAGGPLQMKEITGQTFLSVRGSLEDEKFAAAMHTAAGCSPPTSFVAASANSGKIVFRLGPDEWLVRGDGENVDAEKMCAAFRNEAGDSHSAIVNVSDYYTLIRLGGEGARDALAAGCPLDLHPRVFAAGRFAQSRFAAAAVLLYQQDDAPTFDVQVRWSFADYVWRYLREAGGA